jgi:type II secretory pathway pseudopilin PulG
MNTRRGYSMVEVVAVLVLLFILIAAGIWSFGSTQRRELASKVIQDLTRLDSAKATWRTDFPRKQFPADETSRFQEIKPYVKSGLQTVPSLSSLQPDGVGYFINDEMTLSTATNLARNVGFDRSVNDWYGD